MSASSEHEPLPSHRSATLADDLGARLDRRPGGGEGVKPALG
jgi:hypothetical protein